MSNRKKREPMMVNGKPVVGVIEAARILSQKAQGKGIERTYSRDSIYRRYKDGLLSPAMETPAGNLYFVEDIEKIDVTPHIGKKSTKTEEERRAWYRKDAQLARLNKVKESHQIQPAEIPGFGMSVD